MLLMSVSDVVFTMVPDVTNMALPYCECGLSMAKSIPGMLGRMASGPQCVSWMHTTRTRTRTLLTPKQKYISSKVQPFRENQKQIKTIIVHVT